MKKYFDNSGCPYPQNDGLINNASDEICEIIIKVCKEMHANEAPINDIRAAMAVILTRIGPEILKLEAQFDKERSDFLYGKINKDGTFCHEIGKNNA